VSKAYPQWYVPRVSFSWCAGALTSWAARANSGKFSRLVAILPVDTEKGRVSEISLAASVGGGEGPPTLTAPPGSVGVGLDGRGGEVFGFRCGAGFGGDVAGAAAAVAAGLLCHGWMCCW